MELSSDYYKERRNADWRKVLQKKIKAKERMAIPRVEMPEEDPMVRNKSQFLEVNKGLSLLNI